MLDFTAASFALAGLAAAAGPVIIHLLNRRRFRVIPWAAMDFLREALVRKRRIVHLRDLILLTLRVFALVFLGLALARPFFTGGNRGPLVAMILWILLVLGIVFGYLMATTTQDRRRVVFGGAAGACLAQFLALGVWFWQNRTPGEEVASTSRGPVHAVLVVDNSRSMGVESTAGTLLDRAKS